MPRVLIADALSPAAVRIFAERGIETEIRTGLSPQELAEIIGSYDGLAVRSATKVTEPILAGAHALKVIGRAGIGIDTIDVKAATARGIVVMNTPFGNSITTAEHTIALMLALVRQIPQANASTHLGKWEKSRFMGMELTGKTLGIIGCGNIGSIVASRALGLRMKVIAYDPYLSPERAIELGVEKIEDLADLLPRADLLTLHTPLTDQTRNILDAAALAKCKPGIRIVNCARGGLIDEAALAAALESGHVAGAALDVFETEPAKAHPLFGNERVICTPHLGAATLEAQENVALQIAEQMSDYLLDGAVINAVNMPNLSAEDARRLRPYLKLADQLGAFGGQLARQGLRAITISYSGLVGALAIRPLTSAAVRALLAPTSDTVNSVNALEIARARDIKVTEARSTEDDVYLSTVTLTIELPDGRRHVLRGTLFGEQPRLIQLDEVAVDAELTAHMLVVRNSDKPGFIGALGRTLGDAGINIASFALGRTAPGGMALALVSVDQKVPEQVLARVGSLPNVLGVTALTF